MEIDVDIQSLKTTKSLSICQVKIAKHSNAEFDVIVNKVKVQKIRAAIASGKYKINSQSIALKILQKLINRSLQ